MKVASGMLLAAALLFIAAATMTPGGANISGALRPDFWCLACGPSGGADVTVNIVLFLPLGVALGRLGVTSVRTLLLGAVLSACIEFAQRHGVPSARVANVTDILTNSAGVLAGAVIVRYSRQWMLPGARLARRLIVVCGAAVVLVLAVSAWALSPLVREQSPETLRQSPFPFTPGYGWYHGFVSEVVFNQQSFQHTGDGPVILRGAPRGAQRASVQLTGRDERRNFVPFLYVHGTTLAEPELLLGQEGEDARLSVQLRGSRLRLPRPNAILPGAFLPGDSSTLRIDALVTPAEWSLSSVQNGSVRSLRRRISLALGWTLFQTVVRDGPVTTLIVSVLWMGILWLPMGYWCAFGAGSEQAPFALSSRRESGVAVAAGLCVLAASLVILPRWAGISASSWVEWVSAFAGFTAGVVFASLVWHHEQRTDALPPAHRRLSPLR